MQTKEERNNIIEGTETINEKPRALTHEELAQVCGSSSASYKELYDRLLQLAHQYKEQGWPASEYVREARAMVNNTADLTEGARLHLFQHILEFSWEI